MAWTRSHFIDYVRASGPLPAVRIGKQPYGILPVTSLNAWKPQTGQESQSKRDAALRDFLIRLRDIWRRNCPEIPRLGRSEDTVQANGIDKDLAEVLSMDGLSSSYSIRNLMGRHYLEHLLVFISADFFLGFWTLENMTKQQAIARSKAEGSISRWWAAQERLTATVLQALGVTWRPRLAHAVFSPPVATLSGALVQSGQTAENASLTPNYIE